MCFVYKPVCAFRKGTPKKWAGFLLKALTVISVMYKSTNTKRIHGDVVRYSIPRVVPFLRTHGVDIHKTPHSKYNQNRITHKRYAQYSSLHVCM